MPLLVLWFPFLRTADENLGFALQLQTPFPCFAMIRWDTNLAGNKRTPGSIPFRSQQIIPLRDVFRYQHGTAEHSPFGLMKTSLYKTSPGCWKTKRTHHPLFHLLAGAVIAAAHPARLCNYSKLQSEQLMDVGNSNRGLWKMRAGIPTSSGIHTHYSPMHYIAFVVEEVDAAAPVIHPLSEDPPAEYLSRGLVAPAEQIKFWTFSFCLAPPPKNSLSL